MTVVSIVIPVSVVIITITPVSKRVDGLPLL